MGKLNVDGTEIQVLQIEEDDYISLTDMVRKINNGPALIEKWLRNKNTIEFLGIWEEMYNADFNAAAYEEIMLEAGLNRFIMSVKQWVSHTNSKGIIAKAGRYGGTYAYKDIAFEFASWVSPQFKLYLIKEFERLKKEEQALLGWNAKRELFGMTAKQWKDKNPDKKGNIRGLCIPGNIFKSQVPQLFSLQHDQWIVYFHAGFSYILLLFLNRKEDQAANKLTNLVLNIISLLSEHFSGQNASPTPP